MANRRPARIIGLGVILAIVGVNAYFLWRPEPAAPIVGVVRITEIRVAPEVAGQLAAVKVRKGDRVRAGDVVAELSADELTASVTQARAALDAAVAMSFSASSSACWVAVLLRARVAVRVSCACA